MLHLTEKLKGTTTVGIVCKDGVVLAADKRASFGNMVYTKNVTKIHKIDEHLAIAGAGSVGDILNLVRVLRAEAKLYRANVGKPMSVKGLATLLANILNGTKYFPYSVWFLVGGYDDKPRVFSVDMVGGVTEDNYVAAGSGMEFAYSVLDSEYRENIGVKEGIKLAIKAINAATKRDVFSGDGILVVTITEEGYRELKNSELKTLLRQ
ncbi:archaeal proteasome endopeptidase complex subunit beta [Pyrococcus kukulkanii]|uniref:Proteasome subunit beta n=1 Tax=Pyrococcus kukulkanii TaxID=1609559 RepID=A0A127BD31_9EURY|nr:archaeal proteasome endopeptidase complex subunit beta [Pyrococcus kukulkanii]AMM54719.1 proteasome subunit beta [Pyrococcus kukulkanii]